MEYSCSKADIKDKVNVGDSDVQSTSNLVEDAPHFPGRIRSSNRISKPPAGESQQKMEEADECMHQAVDSDVPECASLSDLSVYNFDAYNANLPNAPKRGRGRPRKDGRKAPAQHSSHVQHRKIHRGRGYSKREDGYSTQPKIFPGRPRLRGKKIREHFISHGIASHTADFDAAGDSRKTSASAELSPSKTLDASSIDAEIPEIELDEVDKNSDKKTTLKYCSLCNLSDASSLGQGKLKAFRPKPGSSFGGEDILAEGTADKKLEKKSEASTSKITPERPRLRNKSASTEEKICDISLDPFTELMNVGFESPPEIKHVLQMSGETYAHFNCAIYSEGVDKTCAFSDVEKAVLNGMFEKCFRCERYGATVRCNVFDCDKIYHYPCAIVSDTLQLLKSGKFTCISHLDTVSENEKDIMCSTCETVGDISDLLMCTICFNYSHGKCIEPQVQVSSVVRIGYECAECKSCQTCRKKGEENKMLVCETCDKSYHAFCLKPAVGMIPKSGWKCQNCRVCGDCGARSAGNGPSSRWHLNYSVCDSCYQQRNKGVACPLCGKAYRRFGERKGMKQCLSCRKYIHAKCDPRSTEVSSLEYVCPVCVASDDVDDNGNGCNSEQTSKGGTSIGTTVSPPETFLNTSLSRESFSSDISISSADSDSNFELRLPKRRTKSGELRRRKKSPLQSKMKSLSIPGPFCFPTLKNPFSEPKEYKTEDDQTDNNNKMVLVSNTDDFVLCQDICVMCGSFGVDEEGHLISCAQCGQCYHSYCAGIKLTPVVMTKGWRCLDCTVCEGCGEPHDESRLLLCDDCDISYHIYCLRPPLSSVPQGNWKCKWCVNCIKCGSKYPGLNCSWQINYTHCGPCASLTFCAVCSLMYEVNDLIVQCFQCNRWSHGKCDEILTEEDAEKCAENDYSCLLCRPADEIPPHLVPVVLPPSPEPEIEPPVLPEKICSPQEVPVKVKPPSYFFMDGICLSQSGLDHIKMLTHEMPKKLPRSRKPRSSVSPGSLAGSTKYPAISSFNPGETSEGNTQSMQEMLEMKSDPTEMKTDLDDFDISSATNLGFSQLADDEKKKKPRKIQKLGIGGFVVKPRGRSSSTKEKDNSELAEGVGEASHPTTGDVHPMAFGERSSESFISTQEKPKRRPRKPKKKTPLDERFPSYLRDAFFGKELMSSCKKAETSTIWDFSSQDEAAVGTSQHTPQGDRSPTTSANFKECQGDYEQKDIKPNILTQFSKESVPPVLNESTKTFASADDSETTKKVEKSNESSLSGNFELEENPHVQTKVDISLKSSAHSESVEKVEDFLDSSFVNLSAIPTPTTSKNFKFSSGFLSDASNSPVSMPSTPTPFAMQRAAVQTHAQSSPVHRETPNLHHQDSNSSWSESEGSESSMSKSTMKWEADENLGLLSTISPVLYANINCPHFKLEYPSWNDRVKQIAKTWRSLPSDKRQPYLQKARENRATSRTQKTTEPIIERSTKETKTQELDHEKQWKQFQALRQLQQQKQQKILQEQRAQALAKGQSENPEGSLSGVFAEIDNSDGRPKSESGLFLKTEANKDSELRLDNWKPENILIKTEDISSQREELQAAGLRSKFELPVYQPTLQSASASSFMQLPQIPQQNDPLKSPARSSGNLLAPSETVNLASLDASQLAILSQRRLTPQGETLGPFSPVARRSIVLSGTEAAHAISPSLGKDMCDSPATPRSQSSEFLFQGAVVPRQSEYVPPTEHQASSLMQQFTSEKRHFSHPPAAFEMNRTIKVHESSAQQIMDNKPTSNIGMPKENFSQQGNVQVPSPTVTKIHSSPMKCQDDSYGSQELSGQPDNANLASPTQQSCMVPQQPYLKHSLKENPDPNKLMAHHQLRELLEVQKEQISKPRSDLMPMHDKGESTPVGSQMAKGQYGASKDDCFRQPFPPTRYLAAKDGKPETTSDILGKHPHVKTEVCAKPTNEGDSMREGKNVMQPNANAQESSRKENPPVLMSSAIKTEEYLPGAMKTEETSECKDGGGLGGSKTLCKKERDACDDGTSSVKEEREDPLNKKRKTTTGDILKDLESQQQGHDLIANACNLDVLPVDVGGLELDDDELLGLGNDFNILEYADPELDKSLVGEGNILEKSNIFDDHLDLDEKVELYIERDREVSDEAADFNVKDSQKLEEKSRSELHDEFLEYEKKDKDTLKSQIPSNQSSEPPIVETPSTDHIKKEPNVSFASCSLSNFPFCPPMKDGQDSTLSTIVPFNPSMPGLQPPQRSPVHSHPVPCSSNMSPQSYRVGPTIRQTLTPEGPHFQQSGLVPQQQSNFPMHVPVRPSLAMQPNSLGLSTQQSRPLLLQEQPLLLEDLVQQEKREREKQLCQSQKKESLMSPQGDALLSDIDYERLKDDVFSSPHGTPDDSLRGQGSHFGPPPYPLVYPNQEHGQPPSASTPHMLPNVPPRPHQLPNLLPPGMVLHDPVMRSVHIRDTPKLTAVPEGEFKRSMPVPFGQNFTPTPPTPPIMDPIEQEREKQFLQHETVLIQQQAALSSQQKYLETEVIKFRKIKKSLNAKQRQLRKNGSELNENDTVELARISQEQSTLQKQLEQVRKQTRQHALGLQDFRTKKQQKRPQQQFPQGSLPSPHAISTLQSSPQGCHSPQQVGPGTPQSPMLPSSPHYRSTPLHIHHSTSSIIPQQPSSALPSPNLTQPPLPPVYPNIFPQQVHFHEEKPSISSLPISSIPDNCSEPQTDAYPPQNVREPLDKNSIASNVHRECLVEKKPSLEKLEERNVSPKVSTSVLSQGLPNSVSYTLNFTLRQTGMPTGCLTSADQGPAIENVEDANQMIEAHKTDERNALNISSLPERSLFPTESAVGVDVPLSVHKTEKNMEEGDRENKHVFDTSTIKKEIMDDDERDDESLKSGSTSEKNKSLIEGSSDEMESLSKEAALKNETDCQNVLLKQLLQNCPSAESTHAPDVPVNTLKQEVSSKADNEENRSMPEKPSDDSKSKKQNYLDIRRAQLEKDATPPPYDAKLKEGKRKRERPKRKKKVDTKEGSPVRKKMRKRSLSKSEESSGAALENFVTQLTNLPPLRILEPIIQPNFNALSVFGSGDMNAKDNQLKGTYGNAILPNQKADPSMVYSFNYNKDLAKTRFTLSLPSPPYRGFYNQEFPSSTKGNQDFSLPLRCTESERTYWDAESPETVLSSSSPESSMFETSNKWPELIFTDKIDPRPEETKKLSYSPVIPLIAPIPIRLMPITVKEEDPFPIKEERDRDTIERDKENIPSEKIKSDLPNSMVPKRSTPLKDSGNVSVTLTLSWAAAEDITNVLSKLANLLNIPVPTSYDIVERTATPPSEKLGLYRKSKTPEMNIPFSLNGKPRFCRHCDIVVLSAGIRKKACDITCMSKSEQEEEDEIFFCSTNCYMQFALTHQSSGAIEDKEAATVVSHLDSSPHDFSTLSIKAIDEDSQSTNSKLSIETQSSSLSFKPITESAKECNERAGETPDVHRNIADDPLYNIDAIRDEFKNEFDVDSDKNLRYKYWKNSEGLSSSAKEHQNSEKNKVMEPFYQTIKPSPLPKDCRRCMFCHVTGDCEANGAGRLLNIDVDKWVHLNCALWSAEVYETESGALVNVEAAYKRAFMLVCGSCHRNGASLKCFKMRCATIYHFACAIKECSVFYKDKTLLCLHHANKNSENELESLAVPRRVYIDRDEHKQVASMIQGEQFVMRIGSLVFLNLGQLLPQQMQAFHTPNCIYPIGYKSIRMYWSMRNIHKRCLYICSIHEMDGCPEFHIIVKETGHKDVVLKEKTAKGLWQKVLYPIEKMRRQAKTIKIFPNFITGDDMFGLTEPAVLRIIESLPGVDMLQDYNFRYGRSPFLELPLAINPTGCARSEPKLRTHVKRSHTLHTSNSTKTTFHSTLGGIEIVSPYIKQFVHSKSSQYRKMKIDWRNNVYLARSRIQGLGLYAARDLEPHTMVIEYIGQLIRNEIAERNESIYDAQNRGIYMFRLDENRVIDATLSGGLARYINHSCNPNCVAENVQIDRENKILITANRRLVRGEELSYDYKFEVEDDQRKISCLCKAPNCRKWMN